MHKRDYELIAKAIRDEKSVFKTDNERERIKEEVLKRLTKSLGKRLKEDNKKFDYAKFYTAIWE